MSSSVGKEMSPPRLFSASARKSLKDRHLAILLGIETSP
jgi:hypothetical protein